jgi:hypothetical protein
MDQTKDLDPNFQLFFEESPDDLLVLLPDTPRALHPLPAYLSNGAAKSNRCARM